MKLKKKNVDSLEIKCFTA